MKKSTEDKIALGLFPFIGLVLYFGWDTYNKALPGISPIILMLCIVMFFIGLWKLYLDLYEEKHCGRKRR